MAPEDECEHEIFVMIRWEKRKFAAPLSQLESIRSQGDYNRCRRLVLLGDKGI
jgi:hypothetical protein